MSAPLVKTRTPGIYQRGSRYCVVFRDPDGRQRRKAARTLAEARALKASLTADVARGEYRALSGVTFGEYAPEWIASYGGRTSRGIREQTKNEYRSDLGLDADGKPTGKGAVAFFGKRKLAAIEPRDVKAYAAHVAARGVAPNTVRLALAPVKALFATAVEEGLIRSNPATGLRLNTDARSEGEEPERVKAVTEAELRALLGKLPPEWRDFFEFLAHTGLRIGEAIALEWGDVDLGRRRVHVRRRFYHGIDRPKSRYGVRAVPVSEGMARTLWRLRAERRGVTDTALVWTAPRGGMIDVSNLRRVLKPAAAAAGVPWVGFHTFRHTCATMLFRHGWNAKQVQLALGHHSPAFTLATYVHLLPDDLPEPDLDDVTVAVEEEPEGEEIEREAAAALD